MKAPSFLLLLLAATAIASAQDSLPAPWKHLDLGPNEAPGAASFASGVFTLAGTKDIWAAADGCQIAWQPLHGDGELVARVTSVEKTAEHAKASICIRESLAAGSRHATLAVTPADGTQFLSRAQTDGVTTAQKTGNDKGRFPCWLKIVRHGNTVSGFESGDGQTWTPVGQIELELPADCVAGLCASSHLPTTLSKSVFDHVQLTNTAAPAK